MNTIKSLAILCSINTLLSAENSRNKVISNVKSKPNVLFICIDDLRPELSCYGNKYIHSPNIDKLAQTGALFKNHFVQVPTSGASRGSMLTGMFPTNTSQLSNEVIRDFISSQPETEKPESFIHQLKRNGYYTVGIGKISHSADGFIYNYTDKVSTVRELPHSWKELMFDYGKWGTGWNAFFGFVDGSSRQSKKNQVKPYEIADVEDTGYPDGLTAQLAVNQLAQLAQRNEPFFLGVGFFKPHLPFNAPKKYWDLYDREDIPLSESSFIPENVNLMSLHDSPEIKSYQLTDEKPSLQAKVSDEYARTLRHAYFASVSYIDAQVGKLLDELERLGIAENTIVVLWGDNGWHLGDNRVWGKHTIFEKSLRTPLIIKIPGITKGKSIEKVVSSIDIYPTIMDACGIPMPHKTDGNSFIPLLKYKKASWEEYAYSYFRQGVSVRTARYRLTQYFRKQQPDIELYDHRTDPDESKNIALEHPELVKKLLPLLKNKNIYK